jgi:hypothetical protein
MFKSLFVAAILAALIVPITQPAHANGLDIDLMPGVSLRIGDKDDRGNYWDGYDWRDRDWWYRHQGRDLGERSRRGYYWDGYRWRDRDYWQKNYYYTMAVIASSISITINTIINSIIRKSIIMNITIMTMMTE